MNVPSWLECYLVARFNSIGAVLKQMPRGIVAFAATATLRSGALRATTSRKRIQEATMPSSLWALCPRNTTKTTATNRKRKSEYSNTYPRPFLPAWTSPRLIVSVMSPGSLRAFPLLTFCAINVMTLEVTVCCIQFAYLFCIKPHIFIFSFVCQCWWCWLRVCYFHGVHVATYFPVPILPFSLFFCFSFVP